ncbi:MAG: hypothetical protein QOE71_2302 [Pseudonocardiales bacterium]|nr:hypothetical protein [Pseudonocardiales bacterium]
MSADADSLAPVSDRDPSQTADPSETAHPSETAGPAGSSTLDPGVLLAAVREHSQGLARSARTNLAAPVEHCPGWTVADLVAHVTDVHWFWATIAAGGLSEPPPDDSRPPRAADEDLVSVFLAGARRMADVLGRADQDRRVWTWAPDAQHIGFITRHQVQEAAVHHWDAAHAVGHDLALDPVMAADAITEFLTFSVSSVADHPATARPDLAGIFVLVAADLGRTWTVRDASLPGTVEFTVGASDGAEFTGPRVIATASELLLWLYGRLDLPAQPDEAAELLVRFKGLCFTD